MAYSCKVSPFIILKKKHLKINKEKKLEKRKLTILSYFCHLVCSPSKHKFLILCAFKSVVIVIF
jgi:hypothetical protein